MLANEGVPARNTTLVVRLDALGFERVDGLQCTNFVQGTSPRNVRDLGGYVVKTLGHAHPDRQGAES